MIAIIEFRFPLACQCFRLALKVKCQSVGCGSDTRNARFITLTTAKEKKGRRFPRLSLLSEHAASVTTVERNSVHISRRFGKQAVPELQPGSAIIIVTATRPAFLNFRTLSRTAI